jgi:curved DNA-binding protein CbpA
MSQPAPTASGTLAATPLGHLLIHALDRRLTGSMVFEEPDHRKHAVYFVAGAPAAARTGTTVAALGALAVEHGALGAERIEPALEAAVLAGKRLGELLVEWAVFDEVTLEALLHEQVVRRVQHIRGLAPDTAYGYYEGRNFLERAGGPKEACPALPLIWQVMRLTPDHGRAKETLARLHGVPLRFHSDAPLAHFELGPGERAVVDVVRAKPQPLAELAARDLVEPTLLERLIYTLLLLRQFDVGNGTQPIGAERRSLSPFGGSQVSTANVRVSASAPPGNARVSVPAPAANSRVSIPAAAPPVVAEIDLPPSAPSRPPVEDSLRREARERSQALKQSYYDVLGVPGDAPNAVIAAAYFQLAKRWHPDRLDAEHADLRDVAVRLFARISEAHQVLTDPDQRKQYDELVKNGEGDAEEQEHVQRLLRAATNFQKAQVMLKRNNVAGAEEAARAALSDAPDEADHIALVAWLEAGKPGANVETHLRELNRAAKLEESNLRVRWLRGQLLKRLGRDRQALEDFRLIVERDPRHVDAQRELRLFEMQRGRRPSSDAPRSDRRSDSQPQARTPTGTPPPDKAGFFGKLFKK